MTPQDKKSNATLSKELQSLQLLLDAFNQTEDDQERDCVLSDIITHPTEEATQFLRLLIEEEQDKDMLADAIYGLVKRTQGKEGISKLLELLNQPEHAYGYCLACDAVCEFKIKDALPLLNETWKTKIIKQECAQYTLTVFEELSPQISAQAFIEQIKQRLTDLVDSANSANPIHYNNHLDQIESMIRFFVDIPNNIGFNYIKELQHISKQVKELAQNQKEERDDLEDVLDLLQETIKTIKLEHESTQHEDS